MYGISYLKVHLFIEKQQKKPREKIAGRKPLGCLLQKQLEIFEIFDVT